MATPAVRGDSLFFRSLEPPDGWDGGRAAVAASQRARMLDAVVQAVAEQGYATVTVADVVRRAGVSRRTFYEHFDDKPSCFLAAYQTGVQMLVGQVLADTGTVPDADWRTKLRMGFETYTRELAAHPQFARTLTIDVLGAGREAVEMRQQLGALFVERMRNLSLQAAEQDPDIVPPPEVFLRALVGGVGELVQHHILSHGAESLPSVTPDLVQIAETVIQYGGRRR